MSRSRKNRSANIFKKLRKTSSRTLPIVEKGLSNVAMGAKTIAVKSKPIIEKGVSSVYNIMAKGVDLGFKGTRKITKTVKGFTQKRRRRHYRRRR